MPRRLLPASLLLLAAPLVALAPAAAANHTCASAREVGTGLHFGNVDDHEEFWTFGDYYSVAFEGTPGSPFVLIVYDDRECTSGYGTNTRLPISVGPNTVISVYPQPDASTDYVVLVRPLV
jgi:hypothetical protein